MQNVECYSHVPMILDQNTMGFYKQNLPFLIVQKIHFNAMKRKTRCRLSCAYFFFILQFYYTMHVYSVKFSHNYYELLPKIIPNYSELLLKILIVLRRKL